MFKKDKKVKKPLTLPQKISAIIIGIAIAIMVVQCGEKEKDSSKMTDINSVYGTPWEAKDFSDVAFCEAQEYVKKTYSLPEDAVFSERGEFDATRYGGTQEYIVSFHVVSVSKNTDTSYLITIEQVQQGSWIVKECFSDKTSLELDTIFQE